MGLFDGLRGITGSTDAALLQSGVRARGLITGIQVNGAQVSFGPDAYRVCDLHLQVFVDGWQPYLAVCRQRVHEVLLPQLGGGSAVSLRVDREDASKVAVVFGEEPPVVTLGPPPDGGAAAILATGRPAEAVIVASAPLGLRNHEGHDVQLFTLTVLPMDADPYQVQIGSPLPRAALPLVFPGARVPVRIGSEGPHAVAVDWAAAGGVTPTSG